jgi:hypothetical protein
MRNDCCILIEQVGCALAVCISTQTVERLDRNKTILLSKRLALALTPERGCTMSDNNLPNNPNPYAAPASAVLTGGHDGSEDTIIPGGRGVSAGQGTAWIGEGWRLFTAAPLIWIVNFVIFFAIILVLAFIPFIGNLATSLLWPVFGAGFAFGAHMIYKGETLEVGHLFEGFKRNTGNLILLGLLYLVATIVVFIIVGILAALTVGVSGGFGALMRGNDAALAGMMAGMGLGLVLIILLAMALFIPIAMAFWFAPALVILNDVKPMEAISASFTGCLRNIVPFLLWGLIFLVLFIVGSIPLGLGLLVVVPLMYASTYAAYRDIYIGD